MLARLSQDASSSPEGRSRVAIQLKSTMTVAAASVQLASRHVEYGQRASVDVFQETRSHSPTRVWLRHKGVGKVSGRGVFDVEYKKTKETILRLIF